MVESVDDSTGRILETLDELGIADNTIGNGGQEVRWGAAETCGT